MEEGKSTERLWIDVQWVDQGKTFPAPSWNGENMLTRKDIDDLFDLLAIFRKNDPHLNQESLRYAWLLVLYPYERHDVREAVGAWFRKSKYWPDPAEIAALCPPLPEKNITQKTQQISQWELDEMRKIWARYERLVALRREAGIPATIEEAKKSGVPEGEWYDILAERGLAWT